MNGKVGLITVGLIIFVTGIFLASNSKAASREAIKDEAPTCIYERDHYKPGEILTFDDKFSICSMVDGKTTWLSFYKKDNVLNPSKLAFDSQ